MNCNWTCFISHYIFLSFFNAFTGKHKWGKWSKQSGNIDKDRDHLDPQSNMHINTMVHWNVFFNFYVSLFLLFSSPLPIHIPPKLARLHTDPGIIWSDLGELNPLPVTTISSRLCSTGSLQAVQCSGQSQAPVPPRLPRRASGGQGCRGARQEEGLIS